MVKTLRAVLFVLGMMAASIGIAGAQAPSAPVPGPIYVVSYVEVMPTATASASTLLRAYREAVRREEANQRVEIVQRLGQPNQFAVLVVWKDQKAFDANAARPSTQEMREKIAAIRN